MQRTFQKCKVINKKTRKKIAAPARKEKNIKNPYLPQVPLPPVSRVHYAHPQFYCTPPSGDCLLRSLFKSFSEHSGRTPRENAIYCLAVASAFKEKRWLQQLEIARVLAKRSISNLTVKGGPAKSENYPESVLWNVIAALVWIEIRSNGSSSSNGNTSNNSSNATQLQPEEEHGQLLLNV